MSHWVFWEWVAYAALFIAAAIVAADTGIRLAPDLELHMPSFLHSGWWGIAPLALVLLATALLVGKEFGWLSAKPKTEIVYRRTFESEIITLDYKSFFECTFKNVTFRYNGGPWSFVNAKWEGETKFETQNIEILNAIDFLKFRGGYLTDGFSSSWRRVPKEHFDPRSEERRVGKECRL